MGNFCSRHHIFGWMMAGRNAVEQRYQPSALRDCPLLLESSRGPASSVMHTNEVDDFTLVCGSSCQGHTTSNLMEKQDVTQGAISPGQSSKRSWFFPMFTNNFSKEAELRHESELKGKVDKLMRRQRALENEIRKLKIELDRARRHNQELIETSGVEERRLKSTIEGRERALEDANSHISKLETKSKKLVAQIALIEQKAAQESLTSGSYSDDHANPGMLEGACKAVNKATEDLARLLHNNSVTKLSPLISPELEHLVHLISGAHPREFSRPIQVKYVWGHWICRQMFQGFEHVYFDVDGGQLTSPLDSKKHALECFRRFQLQKQSPPSLDSLNLFQNFCSWKYRAVFPPWLVSQAFLPQGTVCKEDGRFNGDEEIFERFQAVARAIWLLHELAFSFDPPASILRMARGTPYEKQFHEAVIHVEDGRRLSSQVVSLMMRPAFRVRQSIIRSRVFMRDRPNRLSHV